MEKAYERYLEGLMNLIYQKFEEVVILRQDVTSELFVLDVNCIYKSYRVIISEIVAQGDRKYAFYLLKDNSVIVRFDNSPDWRAIRLKYGEDYKNHYHKRQYRKSRP